MPASTATLSQNPSLNKVLASFFCSDQLRHAGAGDAMAGLPDISGKTSRPARRPAALPGRYESRLRRGILGARPPQPAEDPMSLRLRLIALLIIALIAGLTLGGAVTLLNASHSVRN